VPASVLIEVYRGKPRDVGVDRAVGRVNAVSPLDHRSARLAGALLGRDDLDSCHAVDASVVATAMLLGGATIITGDPDHMRSLARDHPNVLIEGI
jgi:hypothetical protein